MKTTCFSVLVLVFLASCDTVKESSDLTYPITQKVEQSDDYFGTTVLDPYRWLENDTSAKTEKWVARQNTFTNTFLEAIPFRSQLRERLEGLVNYERFTAPIRAGESYLYYRINGLQNQDVIYIKNELNGDEEIFLDPNTFDENGTTTMRFSGLSKRRETPCYFYFQGWF